MPILHSFECPEGHITEKVISADETTKKKRCNYRNNCNLLASRVFLSPKVRRDALAFQPSEFYINSKGEVINLGIPIKDIGELPSKSQSKLKKYISEIEKRGYKFQQLDSFRKYEQFRREHSARLKAQFDEVEHREQELIHKGIKEGIADLKRGFTMTRADGTQVEIPPLDKFDNPEARRVAEEAISGKPIDRSILERSDSRIAKELLEISNSKNNYSDNFHIDAFENGDRKTPRWY